MDRIQDLADTLSIDRRTLYTYKDKGMPIIEHPDGGYCVMPSIVWHLRRHWRNNVREFVHKYRNFFDRKTPLFVSIIEILMDDHEKAWDDHIRAVVKEELGD